MILSLICLAGIIYPFEPFKTRKKAVLGFIITFVASIFLTSALTNNPGFIAKQEQQAADSILAANIALVAQDYNKAEAALVGVSASVSEDKLEEIAQIRNAIATERDMPIIQDIISNDDYRVLTKLKKIKSIWKGLQDNEAGLKALSSELEAVVLELVKPIPSTELAPNRLGYELLVDIDAYTDDLDPSYAEKAQSYARKIEGCSKPDYEFILQVPRRLNDPSSFKPVRIYWGAVNSNGTKTVYMKYRAKNGFGGVISNTATGVVNLSTCNFTLRSLG